METNEIFEEIRETFPIRVADYNEPIDMLLDLIARAEIAIRDVFVSNVTDQYLEYIKTLDHLDIEKASSFVTYATRILDIKVRSLLPKTDEETVQLEEEKESFINELELRQVFLQAMSLLKARETVNVFRVEPEYTKADYRVVISEFNLDALTDAFAHIMHRFSLTKEQKMEQKVVLKDRFTVADKTKELIVVLKERRKLKFEELFQDDSYTIGEQINTFLALLELLRRQFATYSQSEEYGEIEIGLAEGADNVTYDDILGGNNDYSDYEFNDKK